MTPEQGEADLLGAFVVVYVAYGITESSRVLRRIGLVRLLSCTLIR